MSGAQDSTRQTGGASSPEYLNAVEKLKSGGDLAWRAEPRIVASALNDALNTVRAERDRYRSALDRIRSMYGRVCEEYEICEHRSCHDSYSAWAVADEALNS